MCTFISSRETENRNATAVKNKMNSAKLDNGHERTDSYTNKEYLYVKI